MPFTSDRVIAGCHSAVCWDHWDRRRLNLRHTRVPLDQVLFAISDKHPNYVTSYSFKTEK